MPNTFFLQLPKLNKYCLGVEPAPAHQVIKKFKMDNMCRVQNVTKKKKKGMLVTEIMITCTR